MSSNILNQRGEASVFSPHLPLKMVKELIISGEVMKVNAEILSQIKKLGINYNLLELCDFLPHPVASHPDMCMFYTSKGERVRSKSEVIIADVLNREGVPYRYEYPIYIKGIGKIYPDFTVLNIGIRKEMIWDHFGMMDDP